MDQLQRLADGTRLTVGSHRVKILSYLSEGGFAHIYKVQMDPKEDNTDIACLKRVLVKDKAGLDQLRKEVDVMKKLRHSRSIVKYFDSHADRLESGSYQVLVLMELCPNNSLLHYMNDRIKTKLSEREILDIMLDISVGVYEMHKMKMVHRDIKIENVLIDVNNRFKLCDFGSTCSPIPPPKNQQEFQAINHDILYQTTPQYRAPEMIDLYRGFPIDEKADIWALGCFLYKLCYYTTPFEANGDIAILHASYQFLPTPQYSSDLKNIVVIMLQENPILRPNIVQVIELVAAMLRIDFDSLKIEDIYGAGSYNFQALHEHQRKKQQELLQQQQVYYQQQYQVSHSNQPSTTDLRTSVANPLIPLPKADLNQINKERIASETNAGLEDTSSDSDDSLVNLDSLDNVEERYPSLDNIIIDHGDISKTTDTSLKSSAPSAPDSLKLPNKQGATQYPSQSSHQSAQFATYPTQPPVLKTSELKKLNSEQYQQYQFQHNTYQYQLAQWKYYQLQQLQLQQQPLQQHTQNYQSQVPISNRHQKSQSLPMSQANSMAQAGYPVTQSNFPQVQPGPEPLERSASNNYNKYLERKEAWEKKNSDIDTNAGKLADDIFGSKSRSPGDKPTEPQKTSQSTKSEPTQSDLNVDESNNMGESLTKSVTTSKDHVLVVEAAAQQPQEVDLFGSTDLELSDDKKLANIGRIVEPNSLKGEPSFGGRMKIPQTIVQQPSGVSNSYGLKIPEPSHGKDQRGHDLGRASPFQPFEPNNYELVQSGLSAVDGTKNPESFDMNQDQSFLIDLKRPSEAILTLKPQEPAPVSTNHPSQLSVTPGLEKKKSSNPWGEYTSRTPVPKQNTVNTGLPHQAQGANVASLLTEGMNNLRVDDKLRTSTPTSRKTSNDPIEPDLISLELGLESSSSVSTTNLKYREYLPSESESLIDMDFDQEKVSRSEKPVFKRKPSMPNPSQFTVQEEVVDWASDDENPENGSEMNRLSIRSSLKKPKPRRSGEHKRSDSANGEGRKRLSRYLSNS